MRKKKQVLRYDYPENIENGLSTGNKHIPSWYKLSPISTMGYPFQKSDTKAVLKSCMPFLDGFLIGYFLELTQDIEIEIIQNKQILKTNLIEERYFSDTALLPTPIGFSMRRFSWQLQSYIQTPKGYSLLVTHPLNRYDLPFITMSGVVDAEHGNFYNGQLPFFLKENFQGVIEKGTPFAQLLPYKNEQWVSKRDSEVSNNGELIKAENKKFPGAYKKKYRVKHLFD